MTDQTQSQVGYLPPAAILLGRRLLGFDAERGEASLEFIARPEFANRHGSVQGGILAAMLDSAAAAALLASLPSDRTAMTIQLDAAFIKPAPIGPLRAVARLVARDDRSATVEAEIAPEAGDVAARATARFRILEAKTKAERR